MEGRQWTEYRLIRFISSHIILIKQTNWPNFIQYFPIVSLSSNPYHLESNASVRELEIYQKKKNSKHFPRKKNIRCEYCVQRNALYDIPYNTQPTRDKSWKVHFDEIDATEESMPFLMSWNLSREYSRSRFLLAFEPFTECISSRDPPSDAPTSAGRSLALHLQNCFSSTYPVSYRITQPFHSEQNRRIEDSNIEV